VDYGQGMRLGLFLVPSTIDSYVDNVRKAAADGFATIWSPQIFGLDALTSIAIAGREVPGIEFGTAVIPTYPRHPAAMAQMALTTQQATGGRLTLGMGLSHKVVIEGMYGMSFDRPAAHMREYLSILGPLLNGESIGVTGEGLTYRGNVQIPNTPAPKLMIAALAPAMLKLAGTHTDGTILWMTGPKTVGEHIIPAMHAAAAEANRPTPATIVGLPVCLTTDTETAHARAAKDFVIYGQLPSYRAVLDREGAAGPADIALIGDEKAIAAGVKRIADAGATEMCASIFGTAEEQSRTQEFLASLV
jgi:5,10-methylenetetrahydromethanopterin reductase